MKEQVNFIEDILHKSDPDVLIQRTNKYHTGRIFSPDKKDLQYLLPRRAAGAVTRKLWSPGARLNQGQTSSCVGHAWHKLLTMGPITNRVKLDPLDYYHRCQQLDEWPGENYEGTSVRAGADVAVELGTVSEYRWAVDIGAAVNWVLTTGPMVFGTAWPDQMFETGIYKRVAWTDFDEGTNLYWAGGHAYVINGVDTKLPCPDGSMGAARILNSWGEGWGKKGESWISLKKLEILLRYGGEACTAYEK